ncbi:hypothetical protein [Pseudohalioglobus lutimaris]|uniref:Uncharacterized protein n=1 Tax=Pseudohalioglobus lutimaris TaxID=1737061 RepID=A0A2N5WXW7_9GAMM|nr:hypothetical protein [Pseudohalioglobus lutimaris]PLW67090.1 hypothetical protein C0039_18925 [Pseudohalioglobus lutimaris]
MNSNYLVKAATLTIAATITQAFASGNHTGGIHTEPDQTGGIKPSFDIVHAKVTLQKNIATFHMGVAVNAGSVKPLPTGKLAGSDVFSYVWPTSLNSGVVGFEDNAGILALAVTAHPDFDDTPLYDENADNDTGNDGNVWHSHWVVLQPNEQCGKGALGVVDIPDGTTPKLPKTWPGLPILLDSPGWSPIFNDDTVEVKVAFDQSIDITETTYDGVTAGLRVNQSVHAPLLCVVDVMDIASGDLSLPGKVNH